MKETWMRIAIGVTVWMGITLPCQASYMAQTYAFYIVNWDYSDTSTPGQPLAEGIGSEVDVAKPTNNQFKARSVLDTGTLQTCFDINNYEGTNYYANADVQAWMEDNLLVTGGNAGDVVDVIFSVPIHGTLTVDPQNSSSNSQYGYAGMQFRIYGGNVDYIYPDWLNASVRLTYQSNQFLVDPWNMTEGSDYSVSGNTVTVDTVFQVTAQLTVGEWQNAVYSLDVTGDVENTHLDSLRTCRAIADFWNTATVDISLAPGYENYTLVRESGIPEPATTMMLGLGIVLLLKRKRR